MIVSNVSIGDSVLQQIANIEHSVFIIGYEPEMWGNNCGAIILGTFKLNAHFNRFVIRRAVNRP
jgi:hypothetical protein